MVARTRKFHGNKLMYNKNVCFGKIAVKDRINVVKSVENILIIL